MSDERQFATWAPGTRHGPEDNENVYGDEDARFGYGSSSSNTNNAQSNNFTNQKQQGTYQQLDERQQAAYSPQQREYEKLFFTPEDRWKMAYSSFVLVGAGLLFPWNSVISAVDYWKIHFPDAPALFYFSISYQTLNMLGLVLVVRYGQRFSFRSRIVPGFVCFLIGTAALPFTTSLTIAIGIAGMLGAVDAVVQGSIFGMAGMFSPRYLAALMAGQGVAGVGVSVLRIISKLIIPQNDAGIKQSTYIFFALSCVVVILCIAGYLLVLERSPVTKYFLDKPSRARDQDFERRINESNPTQFTTLPVLDSGDKQESLLLSGSAGGGGVGTTPSSKLHAPSHAEQEANVSFVTIGRKIWGLGLAVTSIFFVTLALFPGITSELMSSHQHWNTTGWYSVLMITLFDVGDLIGRSLPNNPKFIVLGERGVFVGVAMRFVFLFLFVACIKDASTFDDPWQVLIMFAFSVSNGYLATLCMMFAVEKVNVYEKESAGTLMVFLLTGGLVSGVWAGLAIKGLVDKF
eukprot:TRINITY_DN48955_c0_g1_i1.p1 TRINITY_DN48955_c0_g1~~TRINITY_DN48955_c0_g1_i1.p1  ORF type:complete len:518 (+),score=293.41 TRINITY_DN48955_c0_g1_i1:115-1668(+)